MVRREDGQLGNGGEGVRLDRGGELAAGAIRIAQQPGVLDLNDEKSCERRWWITDAPLPPMNGAEIGKLLYDDFLTRIANFDTTGAIPEIPAVVTDEE